MKDTLTKFDFFADILDRNHYEKLYNTAKEISDRTDKENLKYVIAVETSKGNIYEAVIPNSVEDSAELNAFLNALKLSSDTHIKYCVGFLCGFLELPSAYLREALCRLDKRNLDMGILLLGENSFHVQQNRVTLTPAILLKFS